MEDTKNDGQRHQTDDSSSCHQRSHLHWKEELCHEWLEVLKNPPEGMKTLTSPNSWHWFHLMEEAMSGRLAGTANIIQPSLDKDEEHNAALPPLILPNTGGAFSGLSVVGTGTLEGVGTLQEVLNLSGIEACGKLRQ
ncbi:uncharacterized protein [Enoplosus armatus]|uniref:uncharacterized protein isoform X2 n=1 Tax=Enoplosus armatus TaxID=215367 RepID=UPI003995641F